MSFNRHENIHYSNHSNNPHRNGHIDNHDHSNINNGSPHPNMHPSPSQLYQSPGLPMNGLQTPVPLENLTYGELSGSLHDGQHGVGQGQSQSHGQVHAQSQSHGVHGHGHEHEHPDTREASPPSPNEEDKRFFKLAKEAIVATATATSSTSNKKILDPTLNDLFTRLQYVSSPHGNPIRSGDDIKVNENGQLMIHEFYKNFPNLNNNIFQGNDHDKDDFYNNETGRLIGDNPLNNLGHSESRRYQCLKCDMNFKRSSDLKRHEKQHLEIPPNICHFCGKGFARKDALKRHVGTATCKRNAEKQLYMENLQYVKR